VDDDRLAQLLHDAVQDSPPATFDADDVLTESRRLTSRRRSLIRNGTMGAVILVAAGLLTGLGVVSFGSFGHTVSNSAGSAAPADSAMNNQGSSGNEFHPNARVGNGPKAESNVPESSPMQGGGGTGNAGPTTGSTPGGCGSTDGELAVALANELPSVGDPKPTTVPSADCPAGTTSAAAMSVTDHGAPGVIIALVRPASAAQIQTGGGVGRANSNPTPRHNVVTVLSQPQTAGGAIPFQTQLLTVAQRLATHF
jgi:hypothetical protein